MQAELRELPDIADRVVDRAADLYYLRIVRDVLSELPVADRELIQWCVVQGVSPGVVAQITGTAPGTVRSRLSRALGRARRTLARHDLPPRRPTNRLSPMATGVTATVAFESERGI